ELDEMSVPTYGLSDVGVCEERIGNFTARLAITGTHSTELSWINAEGQTRRSVPVHIKTAHAEELKELEASARDIQKMLPTQRDRIDTLFVQRPPGAAWPINVWRERYLDHPLVGTLARRLIWEFKDGNQTAMGIWHDGQLVDVDLKPIATESPSVTVRLWHPIGRDDDDVAAWRERIETLQIRQPLKQAHREIYGLEGLDFRTPTWSDRFAGHVLKQHQFHGLCVVRGWKNQI